MDLKKKERKINEMKVWLNKIIKLNNKIAI